MAKNVAKTNPRTKSNNGILIVIILLLVGILVGGGFLGFKIIKAKALSPQVSNVSSMRNDGQTIPNDMKIYVYGEFFTNLLDNHYIKIVVNLGYTGESEKELEDLKTVSRDSINNILRKSVIKDFSAENIDKVKKEMVDEINESLKTNKAYQMYFSEIVIQ